MYYIYYHYWHNMSTLNSAQVEIATKLKQMRFLPWGKPYSRDVIAGTDNGKLLAF